MKYFSILTLLLSLFLFSCKIKPAHTEVKNERKWPAKIDTLSIGIEVNHSPSYVYATENTKDPEKRGKYQLQHATSVKSINEELVIVEFGGYVWYNNEWVLKTIYDRPFNKEEFTKWYKCENGILKKGIPFTDNDNWMGKTNVLSGREISGLWYYIGKNKNGEMFVGAKEISGILKLK